MRARDCAFVLFFPSAVNMRGKNTETQTLECESQRISSTLSMLFLTLSTLLFCSLVLRFCELLVYYLREGFKVCLKLLIKANIDRTSVKAAADVNLIFGFYF